MCVPVLTSLAFFGLKGAALGSATSLSLPFLLMGLREGALLRDGSVAWKSTDGVHKDSAPLIGHIQISSEGNQKTKTSPWLLVPVTYHPTRERRC